MSEYSEEEKGAIESLFDAKLVNLEFNDLVDRYNQLKVSQYLKDPMNCLLLQLYLGRAQRQLQTQIHNRKDKARQIPGQADAEQEIGDQKRQRKRVAKAFAKKKLRAESGDKSSLQTSASSELKFLETIRLLSKLAMEGLE